MTPPPPHVDPGFAARVRALLNERKMTLAELAELTGFEASLLSRMTSENEATRRAPHIEHVFGIARALNMSPADLVSATAAAELLREFVPRGVLEKELTARASAQREAVQLRVDLATTATQRDAAKAENIQLRGTLGNAERELRSLKEERKTAVTRISIVERQRDDAVTAAEQNYNACVAAMGQIQSLEKQLSGAKTLAAVGAAAGGLAIIGTALAAAGSPGRRRGKTSRTRA